MATSATASSVVQLHNNVDLWKCTCGNTTFKDGFLTCNEVGDFMEPDEDSWKELYKCQSCGFVFALSEVKTETRFDLSTMNRKERYELAIAIISEITRDWDAADDTQQWQDENVEVYDSNMSFDELAAEVRAVSFKA